MVPYKNIYKYHSWYFWGDNAKITISIFFGMQWPSGTLWIEESEASVICLDFNT